MDQSGALAGKTVIAVSAGGSYSIALCSDGTVAAWGSGALGQLGNNITTSSYVPVPVRTAGFLSGKTVVKISAGDSHSLAVCSDGDVVSWGRNDWGQIGNGTNTNSPVPVKVTSAGALSGKAVTSASAGYRKSVLVTTDGKAYSFGYSTLGDGTGNASSVPVAVSVAGILSGKYITKASAGDGTYSPHSMVLCSDGTIASWGYNTSGQLGTNTSVSSDWPIGVYLSAALLGKSVTSISAGYDFSLASCSDGSSASWGTNQTGQLGNDGFTNSYAAVSVSMATLATGERFATEEYGLSAGTSHSLSLVASPPWPKTITATASSLTSSSATLNGTVNANSNSTTVSFEHGLTSANQRSGNRLVQTDHWHSEVHGLAQFHAVSHDGTANDNHWRRQVGV